MRKLLIDIALVGIFVTVLYLCGPDLLYEVISSIVAVCIWLYMQPYIWAGDDREKLEVALLVSILIWGIVLAILRSLKLWLDRIDDSATAAIHNHKAQLKEKADV